MEERKDGQGRWKEGWEDELREKQWKYRNNGIQKEGKET